MKTTFFLFTIVGFGAFTFGPAYAAEPASQSSEQVGREKQTASARPADQVHDNGVQTVRKHYQFNNDGHSTGKNSHPGPVHTTPKHTPGNQFQRPGPKRIATAANKGLMKNNKTENVHEQIARLPVGSATTAPRPDVFRSRGATRLVIGGLVPSRANHSPAGLDGTTIKPKP
jgi:hypothetical protein